MSKNLPELPLRYILKLGSAFIYNDQFTDMIIDVNQTFRACKVHFVVRASNRKFYNYIVVVAEVTVPHKPEELPGLVIKLTASNTKKVITEGKTKKVEIQVDRKWQTFSKEDAREIKRRYFKP